MDCVDVSPFPFWVHLQVLVFAAGKRWTDSHVGLAASWALETCFFLKLKSDQNVDSKRKSPISGPWKAESFFLDTHIWIITGHPCFPKRTPKKKEHPSFTKKKKKKFQGLRWGWFLGLTQKKHMYIYIYINDLFSPLYTVKNDTRYMLLLGRSIQKNSVISSTPVASSLSRWGGLSQKNILNAEKQKAS